VGNNSTPFINSLTKWSSLDGWYSSACLYVCEEQPALWMVGILLHACTCVKSNLVVAFLNSLIYLLCTSTTDLHGS
jgi:hypothetical protein